MLIDYHTHHVRCGHAVGTLEQYVQRGIAIGLTQLGLSDHMPLIHVDPKTYWPGMAMPLEELPRYVDEVLLLREKYKGQIELRLGLEADYIEGYEEQIEKLLKPYPWDYVIGSVHFLGTWDVTDHRQTDAWQGKDRYAVYKAYYEAIMKATQTGLYDYIGHLDVIKRFGFEPDAERAEEIHALERAVLQAIQSADMAIELNASGLRTPCAEMFPSRRLLQLCKEMEIPITIGSDAHDPQRLGQYLDQAVFQLQAMGFTHLATFCGRKRQMISMAID